MKEKLFENVSGNQFKLKEDNYAREHPDDITRNLSSHDSLWTDIKKVGELKKDLLNTLDSGNMDEAHKIVDHLSNYHT